MQLGLKLSAIALWKINVMLTLHELGSRLNRGKRVGRLISVYALRGLLKLRVVRFMWFVVYGLWFIGLWFMVYG